MKQIKRQQVLDRSIPIDLSSLLDCCTVDQVRQNLDEYQNCLTDGRTGRFEVEHYGYDGGVELKFNVFRDETDDELKKRQEKNARERQRQRNEKAAKEAREREQYLRLKAKYEGKV